MGRVYLNAENLRAFDILRSLFQHSVEGGAMFGEGGYGDEEGHVRVCEMVERLTTKIEETK